MSDSTINNIELTIPTTPNEETVEITHDAIDSKMTPEDFRAAVDFRLPREKQYWDRLNIKSRQERNAKYYAGDQIDKASLRDDQEKWSENILLRNTETRISLVTSRTPELTASPTYKNEKTRSYALNVRRMLQAEWQITQLMQLMVSRGVRNHEINLLGVFKLGYDSETGEYWTEETQATDLVISKKGDFVAQYIKDKDLGYLLDTFPEKKTEILQHYGISTISAMTKQVLSSPVEYLEVWLDEVVGWKLGEIVLGLENNPHFDRVGQDVPLPPDPNQQPQLDPATGQPIQAPPQTKKVFFNHFKKAKHPYLFLQYINRGIHVFDDTTLLEQGIGLQDWVNKRKRQIGLNADSTNGHWVSSGDFISQEEFDKIDGSIDQKIWLQNGKPSDGLSKVTGQPLPDYVYNDLIDSRQSLNTLMGVENATLGAETNNNTLGQDQMQKQQNMGRADGYVRLCIEVFAQKWYEFMYHLYLVYQTDEKAIAMPEETDMENDNITFSRDEVPLIQLKNGDTVPVPMVFQVKAGSTLPADEAFEYKRAQDNADRYAPIDYFKKIGEPNPRELAKNFLISQADPFFMFQDDPQVKALQQKLMQQKQAEMQTQQDQQAQQSDQQHAQAMKMQELKQTQANTKGSTPEGVSAALHDEMRKAGIDPKQFMQKNGAAAGGSMMTA